MSMLNWIASRHSEGGVTVVLPELGKQEHWPDVSLAQMQAGKDAYEAGLLIEPAFPFLTPDQREFLMTGITAAEWDAIFSEDDDA